MSSKSKEKILVTVLTGTERHFWVNPNLVVNLLRMASDQRFDVTVQMICDLRPFEHARNLALTRARDGRFDWCFQIDNDIDFCENPLRWIRPGKDVIAMPYYRYEGPEGLQADVRGQVYETDAEGFARVELIGTGAMMISKKVWQTIPRGPWFRHVMNEESELQDYKVAESFYFCRFIAEHGLGVWGVPRLVRHFHNADLAWMAQEIDTRVKKAAGPQPQNQSPFVPLVRVI